MTYRRTNIVILVGLAGSVPLLLLVPWLQERIRPIYPTCMLERLVGQPCPMCGLTTGLRELVMGHPDALQANPLTLPVAVLVLLEIIARAVFSLRSLSEEQAQQVARRDLKLHAALLAAYLVYCIAFFAGHA